MKKVAYLCAVLGSISFVEAEDVVVTESTEETSVVGEHGLYYAFGLLMCNSGERVDNYRDGVRTVQTNSFKTHMGGTLALGYQFMPKDKPLCIGLELGSDFSPRQEEVNNGNYVRIVGREYIYNQTLTRNGFRPFVALRLGYVNYANKFIVYCKGGMSYAASKDKYDLYDVMNTITTADSVIKCNCWTPIVALGLEKSFTKDFTWRGEAEYKFARTMDHGHGNGTCTKFMQKGSFNVRVLFCHNIHLNH
ncbi:MAG: hypothetical protein IJT36_07100 [Alphaproteobacteria bacterium]|nr:hypothetical protein [Alphaproteobacteria bacterium]